MKILLIAINAKYVHSNPAVYSLQAFATPFCEKHPDMEITILERTINEKEEEIMEAIVRENADIIAFSCYIWNWRIVRNLLIELPKIISPIPIWLGGPEVTYDSAAVLEAFPCVTGIMRGEGEETFLELVKAYCNVSKGQDSLSGAPDASDNLSEAIDVSGSLSVVPPALLGIPGIQTRDYDGGVRESMDMNRLPFLYRNPERFKDKIIYYESQRGCPYSCTYCLSCVDKKVRLKDMTQIKEELKHLADCRMKQVKFVDRTFNCNHEHCIAIWEFLIENDNNVTNYHFEIAADILREDEIELLSKARPGLFRLEVGIQSIHKATLNEIHRYSDWKKLRNTIARLLDGDNRILHLDLICGLPYENAELFRESFDEVYRLHPQELQLGFLKVLKGTPIFERVREYGIEYGSEPPYEVLRTAWLSYSEIRSIKRVEEMLETYYNSSQFRHTIYELEKNYSSPYELFASLAEFYHRHGYDVRTPSRAAKYTVLYEYITEITTNDTDMFRELLIYDMYLRENLKSRPTFALRENLYHVEIENFYRLEEKSKKYLPAYSGYTARQLERMTHMEYFRYPVGDRISRSDSQTAESDTGWFILFDYSEYNPVTLECRTTRIPFDQFVELGRTNPEKRA